MMGGGSNPKKLGVTKVSAVAIIQESTPRGIASVFEAAARLGRGIIVTEEEKAELSRKVGLFRRRCNGTIRRLSLLNARRYESGHYPDELCEEQKRMMVVITYAIYFSKTVEMAYRKVLDINDAEATTLFEHMLDSLTWTLQRGYCRLSRQDAVLAFKRTEPFVIASLGSCGLSEHALDAQEAMSRHKDDAKKSITDSMDDPEAA